MSILLFLYKRGGCASRSVSWRSGLVRVLNLNGSVGLGPGIHIGPGAGVVQGFWVPIVGFPFRVPRAGLLQARWRFLAAPARADKGLFPKSRFFKKTKPERFKIKSLLNRKKKDNPGHPRQMRGTNKRPPTPPGGAKGFDVPVGRLYVAGAPQRRRGAPIPAGPSHLVSLLDPAAFGRRGAGARGPGRAWRCRPPTCWQRFWRARHSSVASRAWPLLCRSRPPLLGWPRAPSARDMPSFGMVTSSSSSSPPHAAADGGPGPPPGGGSVDLLCSFGPFGSGSQGLFGRPTSVVRPRQGGVQLAGCMVWCCGRKRRMRRSDSSPPFCACNRFLRRIVPGSSGSGKNPPEWAGGGVH